MNTSPASVPTKETYPTELREKEEEWIRKRRVEAGIDNANAPKVGVALSGGGIRSATFCLGFFQALASLKQIRHIDFLSTVSGGGYFGGFLGRFFTRDWVKKKADLNNVKPVDIVEESLGPQTAGSGAAASNAGSPVTDWLRENGRYISPNGAGDTWLAIAVYMRNWAALHYVLGIFLVLTLFLGAHSVRAVLWNTCSGWRKMETFLLETANHTWWWSPWIGIPLLVIAFIGVPLCWSYWLTQLGSRIGKGGGMLTFASHFLFAGGIAALAIVQDKPWLWALCGLPVVSLTALFIATKRADAEVAGTPAPLDLASIVRHKLSLWLRNVMVFTAGLLLMALIGSLGQTLHASLRHGHLIPHSLAALFGGSLLLTAVKKLAPTLSNRLFSSGGTRSGFSFSLTTIAGVLAGILTLTIWSVLGHALFWGFAVPPFPDAPSPDSIQNVKPSVWLAPSWFGIGLFLSLLAGRAAIFLNLSALAQLYSSRLIRAYLGATNANRISPAFTGTDAAEMPSGGNVTEVIPGDNIEFPEYHPENSGGPLHLINITLNETVSGFSQLEQRDRKGLQFAVGPCGLSVGRWDHALWGSQGFTPDFIELKPLGDQGRYHMLAETPEPKMKGNPATDQVARYGEMLSLGAWVGISGAAFTTGLGSRTNLGLSILMGLANVRLGYWWYSGIRPWRRSNQAARPLYANLEALIARAFPVQLCLLEEMLARFHGPNRMRWYLSDGGHFENTAIYELIRRRVPIIICCDDGADDAYKFADMANLVRKARLDYNAELSFMTESEIKAVMPAGMADQVGTPEQLCRPSANSKPQSSKHATVAWVFYDGSIYEKNRQPGSVILFVKPSLSGDEPVDVREYHSENPTFPQQSTLDQFFDEAQWESYRRLGQHIGHRLLMQSSLAALDPAALWGKRGHQPTDGGSVP